MLRTQLSIVLLSLFFLNACSVNTTAFSRVKNNFDFSKINSYSTFERNSLFSDFQNIADTTRNSIELAIEKILDQRGLQYKKPKDAHVVISYHLITNNFKELKDYNKGVKYCKLCLKWSDNKRKDQKWLLLPGSLILDVVDPKYNRSIWRSVLPLKIEEKDNSSDKQIKIRTALDLMLKQFPRNNALTAFQPSVELNSVVPQLSVHN